MNGRGFELDWRKSRDWKGLAGLRRFDETVEMCGEVKTPRFKTDTWRLDGS